MNFAFIPSPEKAKKFTAVEDTYKPKSPYRLGDVGKWGVGKWGQAAFKKTGRKSNRSMRNGARPHLRLLCVGSMNPDLVYYHTNKYKYFIDYEFVLPEK